MTKVNPHADGGSNVSYEPLLSTESSLMFFLSEPAISTITFFGAGADFDSSARWLRERLTLVCRENPWLAGRLVRNKKVHKNVLLAMPQHIEQGDVDALVCTDGDNSLSALSTESSYEDVCEVLKSRFVVGPGYKLVGKDVRCSKFSLVKVGNEQLALIASISHAVADGHTYYKIMSMLGGDDDAVQKLSSVRKHEFVPKSSEAIGRRETKFLSSFPFTLCCIKSLLFRTKANILDAFYLDEEKVNEWKAAARDTGFVSTNDIVTSTFSKATNADLLLMAINLRGRVEDACDSDAGNYSLVVLHDSESSSTPSSIRQILAEGPPFVRKNRRLPGFVKAVSSSVSMITNWAFPYFTADMALCNSQGERNVPLALHLPIPYHPKDVVFPLAVLFKPRPGTIGVLYAGSPTTWTKQKLLDAGAPIGDNVFQRTK